MRVKDPKKIRKLMVLAEVSQRDLAEAAGYSGHSYITAILKGRIHTVTPERAARIARCLEVKIDDLFAPRLSTDTGDSGESDAA